MSVHSKPHADFPGGITLGIGEVEALAGRPVHPLSPVTTEDGAISSCLTPLLYHVHCLKLCFLNKIYHIDLKGVFTLIKGPSDGK